MLLFLFIIAGPKSRLAKRLQFLLENDVSDNTDKTRASQTKKYLEFCALYGVDTTKPGVEGIAFYIAYLSDVRLFVVWGFDMATFWGINL